MNLRGRRVLIFGDSLTHRGGRASPDGVDVTEPSSQASGSPGDLLARMLREAGAASSRINGRVSRSAVNFWRGTNGEVGARVLADEAATRRPDLVIVFLGTNDLGLDPRVDAESFRLIRESFAANGAEVIAVGPPSFVSAKLTEESAAVYGTLIAVFGAKNVIDLRPLTADVVRPSQGRATDGVHFAPIGAHMTAVRLARAILARGTPIIRVAGVNPLPVALVVTGLALGGALWLRTRRARD